jgi:soluble lytic murein transglycosylase-like protein
MGTVQEHTALLVTLTREQTALSSDDSQHMRSRVVNLVAVSVAALVLAFVVHLGLLGIAAEPAQNASAEVVPAVRVPPKPPARGAQASAARVVKPVTLPVDSPWALPPMLVLQARSGGTANAALRRWVLRMDRLALSPAARRSVQRGTASAGALKLLAALPRTGGPLLVLAIDDRHIRAQQTTLWMTRKVLRGVPAMPAKLRPQRLLLEPVASDRVDLAGPPRAKPGQLRTLVGIYRTAGYQYGIDWRILAAINRVETNLGTNTNVSSAGAVGWMQFMPSTWRRWGTDASGDGVADPYDPHDAIFSAARYLDAAGASTNLRRAIFAYNHADWYVNEILEIAASLPDDYGI